MISSDYKDMLLALLAEDVKFILVGGYALAAHGHPRFTFDIDLFVMASPDKRASGRPKDLLDVQLLERFAVRR